MIRTCITALLACFVTVCFSQQRELDSLLLQLQRHVTQDTNRITLLNEIAYNFSRVDPSRGLQVANEAISLAGALHSDTKLASAYSYKAMNFAGLGEDSMALIFYKKALAIHEQLNNTLRIATTYNNIAIALVNLSDYKEALAYHQKAFTIFRELRDSLRMGNSLNNRGVIYLHLAHYRQALDLHFQALRIFERLQNKTITATTLVNIGLVYDHLADPHKSMKYQKDAYALYKLTGDKQGMINTLGNIGNVYHNLDNNSEALNYYSQALAISRQTGDKRGIASNISNIGIVHSGMGNYPEALANFEISLKMNVQSGDKKRIAADLYEIGNIYFHASDSFLAAKGIKNRFRATEEYALRSLTLAQEIGSLDIQQEAWDILRKTYESGGSTGKALNAYKNYIRLRDSIINDDIKTDAGKKEMSFEFEKREIALKAVQAQEHAKALAAIERQRLLKNSVIAIALIILVAGSISFIFYRRNQHAKEKQKLAEFRLSQTQNEMEVLLLQMNPHFIFNSLNSINHYIDNNEKDKSTLYTTKFAMLMRLTLENSTKKEIALSADLQLLRLYLELESFRLRQAFTWQIKVDGKIDPERTFVPPMLLQPFVENSIWHGISGKANGGKVLIEVEKENEMINYIIEDNGAGRTPNQKQGAQQHTSRGMQIVAKRIELLNELKKTNATYKVTDLKEGLRVILTLPFIND